MIAGLEDDRHAQMVERQVNRLDRSVLDASYGRRGSLPYDPQALLKMVLFQYLKGNHSPAQWWDEAKRHDAMKWLGRGYTPSRRAWYNFRDRMGEFIEQIHNQVIQCALDEKHLDPAIGVQDGTTMAACASRHRMVNQATLEKRMAQLEKVLQGDCSEDPPRWVPLTDTGRLDLAARMTQAAEVLAERIAKNNKKPSGKRQNPAKIQVSLSDPIAPLGRDKMKVYRPLYTVQFMVAPTSDLILSYDCQPVATDAGTLAPMIDKTQQLLGGRLKTVLTDSSYCTILDLKDCQERGIELIAPVQANSFTEAKKKTRSTPTQIGREQFSWDEDAQSYRCPQGHLLHYQDRSRKQRHGDRHLWESRYRCPPQHCQGCPLAEQCLRNGATSRTIKRLDGQELLDSQRKKMADPAVKERYRIRGQTVERAFGDGKGNRRFIRFHGRGPTRAQTEAGTMVVAQNLLRLDNLERNALNPKKI